MQVMIVTEADRADPLARGFLNGCHVVRAPPSPQRCLSASTTGHLGITARHLSASWPEQLPKATQEGLQALLFEDLLAEDGLKEIEPTASKWADVARPATSKRQLGLSCWAGILPRGNGQQQQVASRLGAALHICNMENVAVHTRAMPAMQNVRQCSMKSAFSTSA